MSTIFNYVYHFLQSNLTSEICYNISLSLFISSLTFGCATLIILNYVQNAYKKSLRWLYYIYQTAFVLDLCFCLLEFEFFTINYKNTTSAVCACSMRFMLLIGLYALVCAHKAVISARKNDIVLKLEKRLNSAFFDTDDLKDKPTCDFLVKKNEEGYFNSLNGCENNSLIDLNVAYINSVANAVLDKDLTDSERELCFDIIYEIKNLPAKSEKERVKKLNKKLQTLIKTAVHYGAAC